MVTENLLTMNMLLQWSQFYNLKSELHMIDLLWLDITMILTILYIYNESKLPFLGALLLACFTVKCYRLASELRSTLFVRIFCCFAPFNQQHSNFTFSWDRCSIFRPQRQQIHSSQSKQPKTVTTETALLYRLNKMAIIQGKCETGVGRKSIIRDGERK